MTDLEIARMIGIFLLFGVGVLWCVFIYRLVSLNSKRKNIKNDFRRDK